MAQQIDIDDLRNKSAAEIVVFAREEYGVELTGNKNTLLAQLKKIMAKEQDQEAAEEVLSKDVVLENIKQAAVGRSVPQTKLVLNKGTGMVFLNHKGLTGNNNLIPYRGKPVMVSGEGRNAIMDPTYAKHLFPDCELLSAPKEYLPDPEEVIQAEDVPETEE